MWGMEGGFVTIPIQRVKHLEDVPSEGCRGAGRGCPEGRSIPIQVESEGGVVSLVRGSLGGHSDAVSGPLGANTGTPRTSGGARQGLESREVGVEDRAPESRYWC